jgi:penicillin-binding protein 1B
VAIKLKIPKSKKADGKILSRDPVIRVALLTFITLAIFIGGVFSYFYVKYDRIIDEKFKGQIFSNSAKIYSIPPTVRVGEKMDARDIETSLRKSGYSEHDSDSRMGSFRLITGGIEVKPGPDSYHSPEPARIQFQGGKIASITGNSGSLDAYELEPELVTALFDAGQRSKRELVTYDQIPKVMVDAVTSIEDRRFFEHSGVNFVRLAEAAWVDFTHQRHEQGGIDNHDAVVARFLPES